MRGPLIAIGAIVLLIGVVAIAYVLGLGPLGHPAASRSVVFVAISRSSDEADAQEIEAIDLDAGTRAVFDLGSRITTLALSADRRSLYVGLDAGKVALLDASTGARFGAVDLGGPTVVSLVPTADGKTLFAVTVTNLRSTVVPIDLATTKAADPIVLPPTAGAAVLRGDMLIVPFGDPQRLLVAFVDVNTRGVSILPFPRGTLAAPVSFTASAGRTGVLAYDPGFTGGAGLRIYWVVDPLHWTDMTLQAPSPLRVGVGLQAAESAAGIVHVCTVAGTAARRYVIGTDARGTAVGSDCGPLSGGDRILMARRDPAALLVLDEKSGMTLRTLPLAGVPARLVQ